MTQQIPALEADGATGGIWDRRPRAARAAFTSLESTAGLRSSLPSSGQTLLWPWNFFLLTFGCVFQAVPFHFSSLVLRTLVSISELLKDFDLTSEVGGLARRAAPRAENVQNGSSSLSWAFPIPQAHAKTSTYTIGYSLSSRDGGTRKGPSKKFT